MKKKIKNNMEIPYIYPINKLYSEALGVPYPVAGIGGGNPLPKPYKALDYLDLDSDHLVVINWPARSIEHLEGTFSGMGDDNSTLLKVDSNYNDWFYLGFNSSLCTFKTNSSVTDGNISVDQPFTFTYNYTTGADAVCSFNGVDQTVPKISTSGGSAGFRIGDCGSTMRCISLVVDGNNLVPCKNTSDDTYGFYCPETEQYFQIQTCTVI